MSLQTSLTNQEVRFLLDVLEQMREEPLAARLIMKFQEQSDRDYYGKFKTTPNRGTFKRLGIEFE